MASSHLDPVFEGDSLFVEAFIARIKLAFSSKYGLFLENFPKRDEL